MYLQVETLLYRVVSELQNYILSFKNIFRMYLYFSTYML
jgi:hypothetical protein